MTGIRFHTLSFRKLLKRSAMWLFCHGLVPARAVAFAFNHIDLREA
jgi:hypothetical protein